MILILKSKKETHLYISLYLFKIMWLLNSQKYNLGSVVTDTDYWDLLN